MRCHDLAVYLVFGAADTMNSKKTSKNMNEKLNERQKIKRGRITLALIALAFIVPVLIAAWMQRVALQEGVWHSTHHGTLLQPPLALKDFLLPTYAGSVFTLADLKGKWTMLYIAPPSAECEAACKQALYHMRQIRLALGREMPRVQRVLLTTPESVVWLEDIAAEYEGMHIVLDVGALDSPLQQLEPVQPGIYLFDPLGNAMMVYAPDTDPRDILKDIKKLLRISKVG
jgi:cytochrome oxidase Cu insertion factor (SCO1/SenC/PrrC family)